MFRVPAGSAQVAVFLDLERLYVAASSDYKYQGLETVPIGIYIADALGQVIPPAQKYPVQKLLAGEN